MGLQSMQSVVVKEDVLDADDNATVLIKAGQAGYVVADRSVVINGVAEGEVDVRMDFDSTVYTLDIADIKSL